MAAAQGAQGAQPTPAELLRTVEEAQAAGTYV